MAVSRWVNEVKSGTAAGRTRLESLRLRAQRTILWRIWERVLENEFIDRSVALGAKAFVSFFPALIVVAAFAPPSVRTSIVNTIRSRAGLSGSSYTSVKEAFASASQIRRATGVLGLVLTFFYIGSFTAALQRVYTRAWRRPLAAGKVTARALGASWFVGIAVFTAIVGAAHRLVGGVPGSVGYSVVSWGASIGLWWASSWIMLSRQVRWRVLFATGVLTGTAMTVFAATASLWMPHTVTKNQQQFGFFGIAMALVTWLTAVSLIIIVGASAGVVLAEDAGWIGQRLRGDSSTVLSPGAPPALPPPVQAPGLADAVGLGRHPDDTGEPED